MTDERGEMRDLIGSQVVLDTATPYVYVGKLKEWREHFIVLTDVDVHDTSEGRSNKDLYILEARRHGVQNNRREVVVRKSLVVSVSRVEDVIMF